MTISVTKKTTEISVRTYYIVQYNRIMKKNRLLDFDDKSD